MAAMPAGGGIEGQDAVAIVQQPAQDGHIGDGRGQGLDVRVLGAEARSQAQASRSIVSITPPPPKPSLQRIADSVLSSP